MKLFFISTVILLSFFSAFSQEKTISENEFKNIFENWKKLSKQQTYRVRNLSEVRLNGILSNINEESFSEYASPNKSRFVSELKTPRGILRNETIQIGDKIYTRKDEGQWREIIEPKKTQPTNNKKTIIDSNEYFYFGQEIIDTIKAKIFGQVTKSRISYEDRDKESFSTSKTKYWFDNKGLLLKMESEMEIVTGIMKSYTKRTYFYEYDPNIKIEAPLIDSASKQNPK